MILDFENKYTMIPATIKELVRLRKISKIDAYAYHVLLSDCFVSQRKYSQQISIEELKENLALETRKQVKNILADLVSEGLIKYETSNTHKGAIIYECLLHIDNQLAWRAKSGFFCPDDGDAFADET